MISQLAISIYIYFMMLAVMLFYASIFPVGMAEVRNK